MRIAIITLCLSCLVGCAPVVSETHPDVVAAVTVATSISTMPAGAVTGPKVDFTEEEAAAEPGDQKQADAPSEASEADDHIADAVNMVEAAGPNPFAPLVPGLPMPPPDPNPGPDPLHVGPHVDDGHVSIEWYECQNPACKMANGKRTIGQKPFLQGQTVPERMTCPRCKGAMSHVPPPKF